MKNTNFITRANVSISLIIILVFFFGVLLGVLLTSSVDAKYLTILIGAFAGILALSGVIYSKEKERILKLQEIEHEKTKDKKDLLIQKTEEILDLLSTCFITIYRQDALDISLPNKSDFFIQINQIEFIHKAYSIGNSKIFTKLLNHVLNIETLDQAVLINTYDDFRESIMKQTREELLV